MSRSKIKPRPDNLSATQKAWIKIARHFDARARSLTAEFEASRLPDNSAELGRVREVFLARFLREYLPSSIDLLGGHIISSTGLQSPQHEIILYRSDAPRILVGDRALTYAPGVVAIVEVKSNLEKDDYREFLEARRRTIEVFGSEAHPAFLFAFDGPPAPRLNQWGQEWWTRKKLSESEWREFYRPQALCILPHVGWIADRNVLRKGKDSFICKESPGAGLFLFAMALSACVMDALDRKVDWLDDYIRGTLDGVLAAAKTTVGAQTRKPTVKRRSEE